MDAAWAVAGLLQWLIYAVLRFEVSSRRAERRKEKGTERKNCLRDVLS
jgi:hypothetical protein